LAATYSINNAFLTDQARSTLIASLPPGATTFTASRINVDFGGRGEDHRRETIRAVVGVEGTFNDDWHYEVAYNYGCLRTSYSTKGNVIVARYANALNAVRNAAGQIVCGINADANPANDDPACVPINTFGNGAPSAAALNYVGVTSSRIQRASLHDISGFVSGDLSQLFTLPGGPIKFSIGGEYRAETAFSQYDALTASGATFLNAIPTFSPPTLKVKEGFGEIAIPLLKDTRFAQELSIQAAGRVSDYNIGRTGTVYSYNIGGVFAPVRDLRFRVSYARSVRAPTQSDLFATNSQTFLNGLADPCSQANINNNPNRKANCAAAGVPTTQQFNGGPVEPFLNVPTSGISGFNGGNPLLAAEKGTSLTIGAVAQPRFIPGLALSIDYYKISISNAINSLAAQTIINQCYDSPSGINNPFCAVVFRNANGTFAGQTTVNYNGTSVNFPTTGAGASFISQPFNYARTKTSGIDADLSYRTKLSGDTTLNLRGLFSYLIRRDNFTDILLPDVLTQQKLQLGDPEFEGSLSAAIDFGIVDLSYNLRYIGRQTIGTFAAQNSVQGRPPENADQFPQVYYPAIVYHAIRIGIEPTNKFRFYGGVDNLFNRKPPFGLDGTGDGSGIYDNVGRFVVSDVLRPRRWSGSRA